MIVIVAQLVDAYVRCAFTIVKHWFEPHMNPLFFVTFLCIYRVIINRINMQ